MRYQAFGRRTGLRVSEFALGIANFGTGPSSIGPEASRQSFEAYTAAGGTTIDASNIYGGGEAESVLGELLGARRDDLVVITKYSGTREPGASPAGTGNSVKTMLRSVEASLQRLRTDYLDVFMPHFPDGVAPMEEILAGLDDLARAGKIRHGGLSNFPAWRVAGAAVRADLRGTPSLVGIETEYSLAQRTADRELLPMAEAHGLGALLYSPLGGGILTGKYRRGEEGRLSGRGAEVESPQQTAVVDAVLEIAGETSSTPTAVAVAWLRRRAEMSPTALIPIIGPRSLAHLEAYLEALELDLDPEQYARLADAGTVALGTPHEDVAGALAHGFDGDRTLLRSPAIPVA